MMVDKLSQTKLSAFYSRKNQMVELLCSKISKWNENGNKIESFRCDNAGESKSLEKKANGS